MKNTKIAALVLAGSTLLGVGAASSASATGSKTYTHTGTYASGYASCDAARHAAERTINSTHGTPYYDGRWSWSLHCKKVSGTSNTYRYAVIYHANHPLWALDRAGANFAY